jgi:hypothetical protein
METKPRSTDPNPLGTIKESLLPGCKGIGRLRGAAIPEQPFPAMAGENRYSRDRRIIALKPIGDRARPISETVLE